MPQTTLKIIAGHILSALTTQEDSRKVTDRSRDIDYSLELASELIRRAESAQEPPSSEHTLRPRPVVRTREQVIQRPSLGELLDQRRPKPGAKPNRPPSLH